MLSIDTNIMVIKFIYSQFLAKSIHPSIPINIQEETSLKNLFVKEKHGF
jgi:hypothetical protein